ncbi:ROK family protein [Halegenticoccus soli]|uniref:ROK family protein n=1 Tax=Halegenticoccus soli TaxID=1985678 RepID=UPI000C6D639D|nr:ROK family protein [Halegenticoccus soli]
MTQHAVFDIGSTNFRYALATSGGEFATPIYTRKTPCEGVVDRLLASTAELIDQADGSIESICIATTGLVDQKRGIIARFDTRMGVRDLTNLDVRDELVDRFAIDVYLENDVNAAALAEYYFGAGREYTSLLHVNIGSGIGAGIVDRAQLLRGEDGFAGEVGMITVSEDASLSASGVPGAWEAYCSGEGIEQFVIQKLKDEKRETGLDQLTRFTANDLFEVARTGDAVAQDYLDEIGRYNAVALSSLLNVLNPGTVTFGGSVPINNPSEILDPLEDHVREKALVPVPPIQLSELGSKAGLLGALAVCTHGRTGAGERISR